MAIAKCPDCGDSIELGARPKIHRLLSCPHCDADLEVVSLDPPQVDWAYASSDESDDEWEDEKEQDEEEEYR